MATSNLATYRSQEFIKAAGLTAATFKSARRQGLKVLKFGKGTWVRGADWETFLLSQNSQSKAD